MSRNSTHINCNQIAGTVNQGIWLNDCDPCASSAHLIPNIQHWLRQKFNVTAGGTAYALPANTATIANGTAVSQWDDEIGTNNSVQATGANQPLWNSADNTMLFDGTNDKLTFTNVNYAVGQDFTILLGFIPVTPGTFSTHALWSGANNDSVTITSSTTIDVKFNNVTQTITGPTLSPQSGLTPPCEMLNVTLRRENDVCQLFIGGLLWGPTFIATGDYDINTIGNDGTNSLDGKVSTFMQFDRALTDKEIWCLDCYLCQGDDEPEPAGCRIDEFKLACHGDANGTLTANFTGAAAGSTITYLWSTGATTQTISSLTAGSYTCVLTSDNATAGNAADDVVSTCVGVVAGPLAPLSCSVSGIDPYYGAGGALVDGSVTVVVAGGWGNQLTYAWTVPGGAAAIGNVATSAVSVPGTYQVLITDSDGCTTTCQVVINLDTPSSLDIECCINEAPCKDDKVNWHIMLDASATYPVTISANGSVTGTPAWSGGASVQVASHPADNTPTCGDPNVAAGPWFSCPSATEQLQPGEFWQLTVTDAGVGAAQRSQTCSSMVVNPTEVVINETVNQPTYCSAGGSDGTINFTATGGTAPYIYVITDPTTLATTTSVMSGVTSGTYILSATDANGCHAQKNVVIVCPMDPMPTIDHVATNPDCYNENTNSTCDGFITWTPSVQTFTGEKFTLVLYDQGGTAIHTQGPVASFPSPHVFGNGGGNLCAGNYTYDYFATNDTTGLVTNIAIAVPVTLTDPPVLQCLKTSQSQMSCLGNDGAVTITASGGTASYTIAWTGPSGFTSTNFALTGLSTSGVYNYTVTDANGCTCSGSFMLKDHCTFDVTLNADPIGCSSTGASTEYVINGGFNLNHYGGVATTWSGDTMTMDSHNTTANFFHASNYGMSTALLAGPLNGMWGNFDGDISGTSGIGWPTVTPGNPNKLCFLPGQSIIQELNGLATGVTHTYSISIDAATFTSGDEWTIKVHEDNGSSWSTAALTGTSVLTSAGTHTVTFTPTTSNPVISVDYAGVSGAGNTVTWERLFHNTAGEKVKGGYNAGVAPLTGKGVAMSGDGMTIMIGFPNNQQTKGTVKTYKVCNGGATYPYIGGSYAASAPIHGGTAGDAIGDREAISISHDGSLCIIGSPFTDSNGNTENGSITAYYYTTTNAGSCYGVWEPKGTVIHGLADDNQFGHAVVMSGDGTTIAVGAKGVSGSTGRVKVYTWNSGTNDWAQRGSDLNGESGNDNYGFSLGLSDDGNEIVIGGPGDDATGSDAGHVRVFQWSGSAWAQMGADIDGEFAEDFSGTACDINGAGTIVAIGAEKNDAGVSTSQRGHVRVYEWSGSAWAQKGADIDGTVDFGYLGWSVSLNTAGNTLTVSSPKTDTDEFGSTAQNDAGSVKVYEWNSGTTAWDLVGSEVRGQNAGDYFGFDTMMNATGNMFVVGAPFNNGDVPGTAIAGTQGAAYIYEKVTTGNAATGNGCITNLSVTAQAQSSNTTDINVTGDKLCGTIPYTYLWTTPTATPQGSLGANANTAHPLLNIGPGTYQVVVTDANGCTDTEVIMIPEPGNISNSISITSNVTCSGTGGILTSDTPTGGTAPYSYYWTVDASGTIPVSGTTNGPNDPMIDNLAAGTYYLEVTDANGCKWNGNAAVTTIPSGMTLSAVVVDEDLCGDCCGSIDLTVSGGTGPYTYYWTGLGGPYTTEDLSCVSAGSYTVVVTDDNGCTETATYTVGISNYPINFTLTSNSGAGVIDITGLSGGTPNYHYQWTLGGVNIAAGTVSSFIPPFTPTQSGLWCLTVTDSFLPDACSVTQCIDINWVDPVLGYNCEQNFEDTCTEQSVCRIYGQQNFELSGYAHALSGDGTTVVIGASQYDCGFGQSSAAEETDGEVNAEQRAYYADVNTQQMNCGAVRVYTFSAGSPVQKGQTLFGSSDNEWFGAAVDIDIDGNSLVIGASGATFSSGKVYYYKWDGANWIETFTYTGDQYGEYLGETVSITSDGLNIAFGAPGAPDGSGNINHGEIRVYTSTDGGNTFAQKGTTITTASPLSWGGSATNTPALGAVAINDAATRLIVGGPLYGAANNQQGAFVIYDWSGSAWTAGTAILSPGGIADDNIAHSVTINSSGDTVAVGMPGKNNDTGKVVVYKYISSTWTQIGLDIHASNAGDALTNNGLTQGATGLELDASGEILVIGARMNGDGPNGSESGEVKVYKFIDGAWVQQCNPVYGIESKAHFGTSVDISDDGKRISGGGIGVMVGAGYVDVKEFTYATGSTTDHITDGTAFSSTFGANQVGDFATAITALDALPMVAGTWYAFAPTGVSAPTAVTGSILLDQQKGIVQKVTGLTIGHIYDIKVNASTTYPACSSGFATGVASIKVYNGTTAATLEGNNNGGFDGIGDTTVQYKATATTATIMIVDNGHQLTQPCSLQVENLTMKRAQYSCEPCRKLPCDYQTLQLCLDAPCGGETIPVSYDCVEGRCEDPGNGTGAYATLALCNESGCGQRRTFYNCGPDGCYAVTGSGTYATLAACQAECGEAGPPESTKWYCEILCPDANDAERYTEDGAREEEGRYKGERKRERVTGGGKCRIVTGSESPAIAADLQYADQKTCIANCPWCKEGTERPA